jgi:rhodanese-related sulfurtransferase
MKQKTNLFIVAAIMFSSLLLGIIYNSFSSDAIPFIRKPLNVQELENLDEGENTDALRGLKISDVINLHTQKAAIFIDARDQWDHSEGHIPGSLNIPEFSFESEDIDLKKIDKDKLLIVYCDGDDCDTSKRLALQILKLGYANVYVYLGGMNEWKDAGLPIEKAEEYE